MIAKYKAVFNRLKRLNKDGTAPIVIEVYLNRKRRYFPTNISILPEQWDSKTNRVNRKHNEYQKVNSIISKNISLLEELEFVKFQTNGTFDLSDLDNFGETNNESFYEFMKSSLEKRNITEVSKIKHRRALRYLDEFKPNLKFNQLTYSLINSFDEYLHAKKYHQNTVHFLHKTIKTYINLAVRSELIPYDKNPYKNFKLKRVETTKEILTETEIEKIEKIQFTDSNENINKIRDMFLFSCYTGLRFSDLQVIKGSDFIHDGNTVYMSINQEKTDRPVDIPLHALFNGKALAVYEKYRPKNNSEHIFPKYTNQAANRLLKIIAISCGITIPLTFHVGRHTFGTLIAKFTGDQFLIQNLMGHADIKTSQVYIHLSKKHIEDKLKNVKW